MAWAVLFELTIDRVIANINIIIAALPLLLALVFSSAHVLLLFVSEFILMYRRKAPTKLIKIGFLYIKVAADNLKCICMIITFGVLLYSK